MVGYYSLEFFCVCEIEMVISILMTDIIKEEIIQF